MVLDTVAIPNDGERLVFHWNTWTILKYRHFNCIFFTNIFIHFSPIPFAVEWNECVFLCYSHRNEVVFPLSFKQTPLNHCLSLEQRLKRLWFIHAKSRFNQIEWLFTLWNGLSSICTCAWYSHCAKYSTKYFILGYFVWQKKELSEPNSFTDGCMYIIFHWIQFKIGMLLFI